MILYDIQGEINKVDTCMTMTTREIVKEHQEASKRVMKKATRTKSSAREALAKAGILTKDGQRLAKPYR